MSANSKAVPTVTINSIPRTLSVDSYAPSIRTPRTPRFAEATAVNSPLEPTAAGRAPFSRPVTNHYLPQPQDVGFGYLDNKHASVEMEETENNQLPRALPTPLLSPPLKSAMKTPGTTRNLETVFSPSFDDEEQKLEKSEEHTAKEQVKDLKVKTRVRMAKMLLRGVNFSCSLIVLSMLSATFTIFNATKSFPPRNNLPPWALNQQTWPQITLLVIACVSLAMSIGIFYAYYRGGHRRAEKAAVYYTVFAVAFFMFSTVMWILGAAVLNTSKTNGNGQDMWGWSCNQNKRATLFQNDIHYALVCRLQNWSLVCCIIEVVVEVITIAIYSIVFYRFWSKRRLRKSMANRDRARSDLYLAQLRSQSAPNTPGGPLSARDGGWRAPYEQFESSPDLERGPKDAKTRYIEAQRHIAQPRPFILQPPPIKIQGATPKMNQAGFTPISPMELSRTPSRTSIQMSRTPSPPQRGYTPAQEPQQQYQEHFEAAPGEQVYESVPIPGAYIHPSSPLSSPTMAPRHMTLPGQAR